MDIHDFSLINCSQFHYLPFYFLSFGFLFEIGIPCLLGQILEHSVRFLISFT